MGKIDYNFLYSLQDNVLELFFSFEHDFYLTGGTCLSRFYQGKRYSDDLDLFTNESNIFGFTIKKIKSLFSTSFDLKIEIEAKDFCRLKIDKFLQVDLVNDRTPYFRQPVILDNGYAIDNIENILSNKLTAIIGRDDPKDIFDILLIAENYEFKWREIIAAAQKKSAFNLEDLIAKLESFPVALLSGINLIDTGYLGNFTTRFAVVRDNILEGNNNVPNC